MKQIFLLRHAKSDWDLPFDDDRERGLSFRGKEQTKALREYLKESRFTFDKALVSSAERTQKTYSMLRKDVIRLPKPSIREEIYESEKEDYLFLLQGLDPNIGSVCLVGHNPSLEEFGNDLLFGEDAPLRFTKFPTCAFLGLSFALDSWKELHWGSCKLMVYWIPGQIGKT